MSETGMKEKEHTIRDKQLGEAKNEETESYEASIRRRPLMRVAAWICLGVLAALIVLVFVTGITGSRYFLPCLALMIVVPVLLYVVLWLGKVLRNHREKQS
ncbi:MAG: hypothetical protein PUG98_07185 [Clostridium sp.]|nr:hypothetical protein [Clostridium sp.]